MLYSEFVTGTGIENHDLYECVEKVYNNDDDMTKQDAYYIAQQIPERDSVFDMYFEVRLEYRKVKLEKEILQREKELNELKSKYRHLDSLINREFYGQIDD